MTGADEAPVVHIMGPDLIGPCGAGVGPDGWHHTTAIASSVTCAACLEYVHA